MAQVRCNRIPGNHRGQTLVIALMVMFILAVIAAIFIALVARNLFRSERFSNVDVVAQIAEAGIRHADKMLTSSEDGADWRPVPDNVGIETQRDGTPKMNGGVPQPTADWQRARDSHPDFKWVRAYWPSELPAGSPDGMGYAGPSGGYSTVNTGDGRFLLRVSYNPRPEDPYSKYIKIESIGRWGTIDNKDPTTWKPYADSNLRREITAYKPIGVTDYLRFVTNKGNRSGDFALGCPDVPVRMGREDPDAQRKNWYRGGPIRVNGNLVWHGGPTVNIYLRGTYQLDQYGNPTSTVIPIDSVEVAGDIRSADSDLKVWLNTMNVDGSSMGSGPIALLPSDDPNFRTESGFYRDGSDLTDVNNAPRGVKRIDPPLVDQLEPTNSVSRYLLLTLYSGERQRVQLPYGSGSRTRWMNLAEYGWGRGVYISNRSDSQDESDSLIGAYTLRNDWMNPNQVGYSRYWKGPFYTPPGCSIILNPDDTDGDGQADFTIVRTDTTSNGRKFTWRDAWGNTRSDWGGTVTMPYCDPTTGQRTIYFRNTDGTFDMGKSKVLDWNGVIYAEGNIRIRGMLPPNRQLTIVSNENIYIEGNLLKYRDPNNVIDDRDPWRGADPTCGLALLARQNICINTTQFFTPLTSIRDDNYRGAPYNAILVRNEPDSWLRCAFDFGPWESESPSAAKPTDWAYYLRATAEYSSPSYINVWLNPAQTVNDWGVLYTNLNGSEAADLPQHVWGVGDPRFNPQGWGLDSTFACNVFPLDAAHNASQLRTRPGIRNLLHIGLDQTTYTRENCWVGRPVVQPMDIRIEAILYAQEGSLFVIPGDWFNLDPNDVPGGRRPAGVDPMFPHFGQPLDVRIIVDGAVSENVPASISDVAEWMAKWGNIPEFYGSTKIPTTHPNEGFTILYDDHTGWPYSDLRNGATPTKPIRTDRFGRQLPLTPRLPVSGSLVYFGDVM